MKDIESRYHGAAQDGVAGGQVQHADDLGVVLTDLQTKLRAEIRRPAGAQTGDADLEQLYSAGKLLISNIGETDFMPGNARGLLYRVDKIRPSMAVLFSEREIYRANVVNDDPDDLIVETVRAGRVDVTLSTGEMTAFLRGLDGLSLKVRYPSRASSELPNAIAILNKGDKRPVIGAKTLRAVGETVSRFSKLKPVVLSHKG